MMHADDTLAGRRRMQMQSSREEREARERLAAACGLPHVPAATLFSRRENPCTLLHLNLVITLWNSDVYVFDKFVAFLSSYTVFVLCLNCYYGKKRTSPSQKNNAHYRQTRGLTANNASSQRSNSNANFFFFATVLKLRRIDFSIINT